jgi:hypothetical protein
MGQQMILSKPSIIIIWTNQDMMEWMSRILNGEMAGTDEDFGSKVRQMWLNFVPRHNHKSTQHLPQGSDDDPFKTINYQVSSSGHIRTWWNV